MRRETTKNGAPHVVPLHHEIGERFYTWAKAQSSADVFSAFPEGGSSGRGSQVVSEFAKLLRRHATACGIALDATGKPVDEHGRRLTQHCLRHTWEARSMGRMSADARRLLTGHAGADVDESVYANEGELGWLYSEICKMEFGLVK
jgi:integrase